MAPLILVVDDEPDLREIIAEELLASGFRVLQAANGKAALGILQNHEVDLMLSDMRMPGITGLDLLYYVQTQELTPKPHVLLMTGFSDLSPHDAQKLGAKGLISKPFRISEILAAVRLALLADGNRDEVE